MMIQTLIRGLMLLTVVAVLSATTYGNSMGPSNVAISDASGVFIIPGLVPNLKVSNPGNFVIPSANHDYVLGAEGFFLIHGKPNPPLPKKEGIGGLGPVGTPGQSRSPRGGSSNSSLVSPPASGNSGSVAVETPEPSALLLLSSGLAALALYRRRKLQLVPTPSENHASR